MKDPDTPYVDEATRRRLRELARASLEAAARGRRAEVPPLEGMLAEPAACFVSLHTGDGRLRGCIGTIAAIEPLGANVVHMAESASQRDPRFPPVEEEELDDLEVEISVLTPLEEVEDPSTIEPGVHGLRVQGRGRSGLLLPQVATSYGWDRETFLDETCRKAGLPRGAWREPGVRVFAFRAEVF